jgi:hypothetical protein
MHARRTRTTGPPDKVEKGKQVIETVAIPKAKDFKGFKGGYWLIDRETGTGLTFTFFETKADLEASAAAATQVRSDAVKEIGGQVAGVDSFEVVADTGQKVHHDASHARVIEFQIDRDKIDGVGDALREFVIPRVKQLPGFVGGVWLLDRDAAKGVGLSLFDSQANLDASREAANAIRSQSGAKLGGTPGEFEEFEILTRAETPAGAAAR